MSIYARKIISLFLALAIMVIPVRAAFSEPITPISPSSSTAPLLSNAMSTHGHDCEGMLGAADKTPCGNISNNTLDTPNHCPGDAHCCIVLLSSLSDTTHTVPGTPRSTLLVIFTGIIPPTATKPPRHNLLG